jgi:hypothetical protein
VASFDTPVSSSLWPPKFNLPSSPVHSTGLWPPCKLCRCTVVQIELQFHMINFENHSPMSCHKLIKLSAQRS